MSRDSPIMRPSAGGCQGSHFFVPLRALLSLARGADRGDGLRDNWGAARDDAEFVLRSPADGYTIFAGTISTHAINVALRPELSYHPVKDFAPVTMPAKQPSLPDVPTLAEQGLKDLEVTSWHALFVRAGTPAPIVERLSRSFEQLLKRPDNRRFFEREGAELVSSTPQELAAYVEAEIARWTKVTPAGRITAN